MRSSIILCKGDLEVSISIQNQFERTEPFKEEEKEDLLCFG